jgi:chromate transporter
MSLLEIFLRFLYVGLFTVGGGLASIPLMLQSVVSTGLVGEDMFYSMIAISESTPGPIGVNLATYIGFSQYGILGGIVTTLGVIIPCLVISLIVSRAFEKFSGAPVIKAAFYGVRAIVAGLIATAAWGVLRITVVTWDSFAATKDFLRIVSWPALAVFAALLFLVIRFKKHPVLYIALGGVAGLFLF